MCDIEICLNCSLFIIVSGFLILSHTHMSQDASSNLTSLWSNSCALQHWGPMRWSKSSRMGPFHSMGGSECPISTSGNCRGFHRSSLFLQGLLLWLLRRQETIMLSVEVPWKQEFNTKWVLYTIPNWREYPVKIVFFLIGKMRINHWNDILSIMGYRGITQTRALHALCCSGFYQTRGAKPQISTEPDDL